MNVNPSADGLVSLKVNAVVKACTLIGVAYQIEAVCSPARLVSCRAEPLTIALPFKATCPLEFAKPLAKFNGPLPGRILLAPPELERAGQR